MITLLIRNFFFLILILKSQGMTGFGTARRETTKMKDTKHPEYDHERPDQSEIPLQAGTNKFASQKVTIRYSTIMADNS